MAPRTALVTGASSGIGRALATTAASEGFTVLALARREQRLTELCTNLTERFGVCAEPVVADLARADTPARVVAELAGRGHVVDLLINNASFSRPGNFIDLAWDVHVERIQVAVTAILELTHRLVGSRRQANDRARRLQQVACPHREQAPNTGAPVHGGSDDAKFSTIGTIMMRAEALERFLSTGDAAVQVRDLEPIFGGWNSSMSKLVADFGDGPTALVVRKHLPATARVVTTDLQTEWEVLSALNRLAPRVAPRAYRADLTGEHLGEPTMLTEFISGTSLQAAVMTGTPEDAPVYREALAALAGHIHSLPVAAMPAALQVPGSWDDYIDRRLEDWRRVESAWVERSPVMRFVGAWLDAHRPPPLPLGLVHGDFHTSNTMVETDGGLIAVDWEFAHIGDPREDLGWTTIYESIAPPQLVTADQKHFCQSYCAQTGLGEDVVNPATIAWFSLLNIATVVDAMIPAFRSIVDGTNTSMTNGMSAVMGVTHGEHCLRIIASLETAS